MKEPCVTRVEYDRKHTVNYNGETETSKSHSEWSYSYKYDGKWPIECLDKDDDFTTYYEYK